MTALLHMNKKKKKSNDLDQLSHISYFLRNALKELKSMQKYVIPVYVNYAFGITIIINVAYFQIYCYLLLDHGLSIYR